MVFKKFYCSKCGEKLEKEKTYRVVSKDDKDYYQYHEAGQFPRVDYAVHDYRFMCPSCANRISYEEQCIISRIQKKKRRHQLSDDEIVENYQECKKAQYKNAFINGIIGAIINSLIFLSFLLLSSKNESLKDLGKISIMFAIFAIFAIVNAIRSFKGNYKLKYMSNYSYEMNHLLNKLHTYSSNNKTLIEKSEKCHCFHCKSVMESKDVTQYADDGQTAMCPACKHTSIIPDSIDDVLDENIIDEMNKYWF